MSTLIRDEEIARELARRQHGAVTRTQLRTTGLSRTARRSIGDSSRWSARADEVLVLAGSPATLAQHLMIAVLDAGPAAALSHPSSGWWWGLRGGAVDPVHTSRTTSSTRQPTLSQVHQLRELPAEWVTVLEGVPTVRPELLSLQLFATCSYGRAERLTERMWADRLLSGASLDRFLTEYGSRGRNGTAGLRRYLADRGAGYTPAASGLEARVLQILRDAGLEFRRQIDSGGARWTGRVDFRHLVLPLIIEVQSERHHDALVDQRSDTIRTTQLEADGFIVLELRDSLVWTNPGEVVRRVQLAIASCRSAA